MALSYKNIVITPNTGSNSEPKIVFSGANTTVNTDITIYSYPSSNGTLSFEGSAGQLFSVTNSLSGTIFSVNDVSGIPSIEVEDTGAITLARFSGNVGVGTATATQKVDIVGGIKLTGGINANNSLGTVGQVLASNGSIVYWTTLSNTDLVQSNVSSLTTSVNTIKANVDSVQSNVSTNTTRINTVQSNVTTVVTNLNTVQSNVSSLTTSVNTIKANVDSVSSNVSTNTTRINTVQSNVTTLTSGVNGIQANINSVQSNVSSLTTSVNTIKANVDSVSSNVTTILTGTTSFSGSKTFAGPVVLSNTLSANGSVGTSGQVLTSNAAGVYWSTPSSGGVTTGKAIAMAMIFGG